MVFDVCMVLWPQATERPMPQSMFLSHKGKMEVVGLLQSFESIVCGFTIFYPSRWCHRRAANYDCDTPWISFHCIG